MIERRLVTDWVVATLEEASGKPVGRGKIPASPGNTPIVPPYYIVHSLPMTLSGAPIADMHEDASLIYQFTCVSGPDPTIPQSTSAEGQAEWLADKARTAFLGRDPVTRRYLNPLGIAGWKDLYRDHDVEPGATNDPADAIISYVLRVRFDLTPA